MSTFRLVMYKAGQVIIFDYEHDGVVEKNHKFILADSHDSDYIFQLICIEGYHAGVIEGYISKENGLEHQIREEHLKNALNKIFLNIHWGTFKIPERK